MNSKRPGEGIRNQKPVSINIYYNINSKNVTNSHNQPQNNTAPISARQVGSIHPLMTNNTVGKTSQNVGANNKQKSKGHRLKKKKYSMDLTSMNERKYSAVNYRKSFNNSVCSGTPTFLQNQNHHDKFMKNDKNVEKILHSKDNAVEEKQKKLNKLLEGYSDGSINKHEIAKKILNIFEATEKHKTTDSRKFGKKKQSQSTLYGVSSPRDHRIQKLNHIHNPKYLNKTKKKQTKSEKCSINHSKATINVSHINNQKRQAIAEKIVEIKGIDSSLFLPQKQEQKILNEQKIGEVYTSNSVIDLNQHLYEERKSFPRGNLIINPYKQRMVIRIQRAIRRYRTKKIINSFITAIKSKFNYDDDMIAVTDNNQESKGSSQLDKISIIGSLNNLHSISQKIDNNNDSGNLSDDLDQLSNFLSQQMPGLNTQLKKSQKNKGQTLRNHQLSKWNDIMQYVSMNMNNKNLAPKQCLERIIQYFQNAKNTVQKQLMVGAVSTRAQNKSTDTNSFDKKKQNKKQSDLRKQIKKKKQQQGQEKRKIIEHFDIDIEDLTPVYRMRPKRQSPQITQFTNKFSNPSTQNALQLMKMRKLQQQQQFFEDQGSNNEEESEKLGELVQETEQLFAGSGNNQEILEYEGSDSSFMKNQKNYFQSPSSLSLDKIQQSLMRHYQKTDRQHEAAIQRLHINSDSYMSDKLAIDRKYSKIKDQLKRIIHKFKKGYQQAKNILQSQLTNIDLHRPHSLKNYQNQKVSNTFITIPQNNEQQDLIANSNFNSTSINNNLRECGSKSSLSKCKSDNYLLRTAINYKKFIEKKQKDQGAYNQGQSIEQNSDASSSLLRHSDNAQILKIYHNRMMRDSQVINTIPIAIQQQSSSSQLIPQVNATIRINQEKDKQQNIQDKLETVSLEQMCMINEFEDQGDSQEINRLNIHFQNMIKNAEMLPMTELVDDSKIKDDYPEDIQLIATKSNLFNKNEEQQALNEAQHSGYILDNIIMSAELLQYEELNKQFDDQQEEQNLNFQHQNQPKSTQEISLLENNRLNRNARRFQCLTSEEKDDIFEFLFIDLCLQIITEYEQNTPIYSSLMKQIEKRKRLENVPRGIKTSLNASKEYLSHLFEKTKKDHWKVYLKNIGTPMGPTAKQMLKYMHDNDDDDSSSEENVGQGQESENVPIILPINIFEDLQSVWPANYPRYYDDDEKQGSRIRFLRSLENIHHKALFDSVNQWLDIARPYGLWGPPFPWRTSQKSLGGKAILDSQKKGLKLNSSISRVVQCCSYLCGILIDKEDSVFGNHKVSENYVEQIREDRMCKMLSNELHENEDRWNFFDDEETEVIIEISRFVQRCIIQTATYQFANLLGILPKSHK